MSPTDRERAMEQLAQALGVSVEQAEAMLARAVKEPKERKRHGFTHRKDFAAYLQRETTRNPTATVPELLEGVPLLNEEVPSAPARQPEGPRYALTIDDEVVHVFGEKPDTSDVRQRVTEHLHDVLGEQLPYLRWKEPRGDEYAVSVDEFELVYVLTILG